MTLQIELNTHMCESENEYKQKYTNSKLVFLKDECKFIFNSELILTIFLVVFINQQKLQKKLKALLSDTKIQLKIRILIIIN